MGADDVRAMLTSIKLLLFCVLVLVMGMSGLVEKMTALVVERLEGGR